MTAGTDSIFENLVDKFSQIEKNENKNVNEGQLTEGQFSWHASDTDEPIYSTEGHQETIFMIDDKGNKWQEDAYEGYGVFGGKDFYELLAEMNGLEADRQKGIDLAFKDSGSGENAEGVLYPKLVSDPDAIYEEEPNPRNHRNQGWYEDEGRSEHDDEDADDYGFDDSDEYDDAAQEESSGKPKLNLVGEDGNAFAILGRAKQVAKRAGWSKEEIKEFMDEAMSGDYDHLLQTCMKFFDVNGVDDFDERKVKEQKEIPVGFDINGNEITKGDKVSTSDVNPIQGIVNAVWNDGSVDIEYTSGPGGPLADTFDIKGHGVQKLDVDEEEIPDTITHGYPTDESKVNEVFKTEEDVSKFVEKNARVTGELDTRVSVKYGDKLYQSEDTHDLVVQICKDKNIACESKINEKKANPMCSICNKKHWPFQKCVEDESKGDKMIASTDSSFENLVEKFSVAAEQNEQEDTARWAEPELSQASKERYVEDTEPSVDKILRNSIEDMFVKEGFEFINEFPAASGVHLEFKKHDNIVKVFVANVFKESVDEAGGRLNDWAVFITKPMKKRISKWLPEIETKKFAKLLTGIETAKAMSKEDAKEAGFNESEELTSRVECKGCGEMFDATGEEQYCSDFCREKED